MYLCNLNDPGFVFHWARFNSAAAPLFTCFQRRLMSDLIKMAAFGKTLIRHLDREREEQDTVSESRSVSPTRLKSIIYRNSVGSEEGGRDGEKGGRERAGYGFLPRPSILNKPQLMFDLQYLFFNPHNTQIEFNPSGKQFL